MGLMERTKNLLTTNLEELAFDENAPSRLGRYARDLEWTHRELAEAARHADVERRSLQNRLESTGQASRQWTGRAELALRHQEEPLARLALLKKIEIETDNARVARHIARVCTHRRELDHHMQQLRERILAARYLRKVFAAGDAPTGQARVAQGLLDEVERELDALKRSPEVAERRDEAPPMDTDGEST